MAILAIKSYPLYFCLIQIGLILAGSPICCRGGNPGMGDGEGAWAIGMLTGIDPFHLSSPRDKFNSTYSCLRNPIIACSDINDSVATFVADPFLFFPNGTNGPWYAFFEVKNMGDEFKGRRGQIGVAGVVWSYIKVVLAESVHLSYPFVIEHKGVIYMFAQGKSFSYWKCEKFPDVWIYQKKLHNRSKLNDNSIVFYQNKWWMFSFHERSPYFKSSFLHVFYAEDLLGPWVDTANNCWNTLSNNVTKIVCVGNTTIPHKADRLKHHVGIRPGGRPFVYEEKLYRIVQHSINAYGDQMDLYLVENLSIDSPIAETVVPEFRANLRKSSNIEFWNEARYHHIDLHQIIDQSDLSVSWVALYDGDASAGSVCRVNTIKIENGNFSSINKQCPSKRIIYH